MGEFSPIHWLILFGIIVVGVPWLAYGHGRKVGDQQVTFADIKRVKPARAT